MKKRLLALVITLAMLFSLFPTAAFADEESGEAVVPVEEQKTEVDAFSESESVVDPELEGDMITTDLREITDIPEELATITDSEEPNDVEQVPDTVEGTEAIAVDEVYFPDPNFRAYVSETIDKDQDGLLTEEETADVKVILCQEMEISSLKGIELFENLVILRCYHNQLMELDVSANRALDELDCHENQLTTLNLTENTALTTLRCDYNSLEDLDLSSNTALLSLDCGFNPLGTLDLSANHKLRELGCCYCHLTELNLNAIDRLYELWCYGNSIGVLDLTKHYRLATISKEEGVAFENYPETARFYGPYKAENPEPGFPYYHLAMDKDQAVINAVCVGECGENLTWTLDENGILTISGTGPMYDYYNVDDYKYPDWNAGGFPEVNEIVIGPEVTSIGNNAFSGSASMNVTDITIPASVTRIGDYAFRDCVWLTALWFEGECPEFGTDVFEGDTLSVCYPMGNANWLINHPYYDDNVTWKEYTACGDHVKGVLYDNTLTIIGTGDMWDYEAPTSMYMGNNSPFNFFRADTLVVNDGVTGIGVGAFPNSSFVSVTIPQTVTKIGDYAFYTCESLTNLSLSEGLMSIGESAFCNCRPLTGVTIPSTVTRIGANAFSSCDGLTTITIPAAVENLGKMPFANCASLTEICVDSANPAFTSEDGILYDKGMTELIQCPTAKAGEVVIPDGVTSIRREAFSGCNRMTEVVIPNGITTIEQQTFFKCFSLTRVVFPDTLSVIGPAAFNGCSSLTSVQIPDGVTAIGGSAFYSCGELTTVSIPITVTEIGVGAFARDEKLSVITFSGTTAQFKEADKGSYDRFKVTVQCSDGKILPNSPDQCGDNLTWSVNDGVLTISGTGEMWDFVYDNQPWQQFKESITSVILSEGVTSVGNYAFYYFRFWDENGKECGLSDVSLPSTLTRIGAFTFSMCRSLKTLVIPQSVTEIGSGAFANGNGLNLYFTGDAPAFASDVFGASSVTVYYPSDNPTWTEEVRQNYDPTEYGVTTWIPMEGTVVASGECGENLSWTLDLEGTLTISGVGPMDHYISSDASVNSAAHVAKAGLAAGIVAENGESEAPWSAQRDLIRSVVIEDGVTGIGNAAFKNCDRLTKVTVGKDVASVGAEAFADCENLSEVWFEGDCPSFAENCFAGDTLAVSYSKDNQTWANVDLDSLGGTVQTREYASCGDNLVWFLDGSTLTITGSGDMWDFNGWDNVPWYNNRGSITTITLPEGLTSIGNIAFYYCDKLTSVTLPSSLRTIGNDAFNQCTSLTSVTIPEGVTIIGYEAFEYCRNLADVTIPASVIRIDDRAFYNCSSLASIHYGGTLARWQALNVSLNRYQTSVYCSDGEILAADMNCCGEDLTWTLDANGTLTITGSGDMWDFIYNEVPWYSNTNSIKAVSLPEGLTSVGNNAFFDCRNLTSVSLPESLERIGECAFERSGLTDVVIPEGVTSIGYDAFEGCSSLTSVTIPASVKNFEYRVFSGCTSLISVILTEGLTTIGNQAFDGCSSLNELTIPASVTSISLNAFSASSLATIHYDGTLARWRAMNVSLNRYQTSVYCSDGEILAAEWNSCGDDLVWSLDENGILTISGTGWMWDFSDSYENNNAPWYSERDRIKAVTLSEGVASIGSYAFNYCGNMTSVTIPEGVISIGSYAFNCCGNMTSLTIPEGVISIGGYAFCNCSSLTSVTIPASVASINLNSCNSLSDIYYSGTSSQWEAMKVPINRYRTSVHCGDGKTILLEQDHCGEDLTWTLDSNGTLTISGSGEMWDFNYDEAPWYSERGSITAVVLPESLNSIGDRAFYYCDTLTSIMIPESVTSIGDFAFSGCSSLTGVTIPESVTTIGIAAFSGCRRLTSVEIPPSVNCISEGVFDSCLSLTSVSIPKGVTSIGGSAFWHCTHLTSVTIPDGVTGIGFWAFYLCTGLADITIPASVTSIGEDAFYSCGNLSDIYYNGTISQWETLKAPINRCQTSVHCSDGEILAAEWNRCGDDLTWTMDENGTLTISGTGEMWDYNPHTSAPWYSGRNRITAVILPEGLTCIGDSAFYCCESLTSIKIPESVTSIGEWAFYGCSGLNGVTIPESMTSIEDNAFAKCIGLTSVTIPEGVICIGESAFGNCAMLSEIDYLGTITQFNAADAGCFDRYNVTVHCGDGDILPVAVEKCGYNVTWELNNGVLYIKGFGDMWSFPLKNMPWQSSRNMITTVIISEGVTSVGSNAFSGCNILNSVSLPESLMSIGGFAFSGCNSLKNLTIPKNVSEIGRKIFGGSISTMPSDTMTLYFTGDAPKIDMGAFASKKVTAYYPANNPTWTGDVLHNYIGTEQLGTTTWIPYHPTVASGSLGTNLSWTLDDEGTLTISGEGEIPWFYTENERPWPKGFRKLIIEEGVTSIGQNAFELLDALSEVYLPSTMRRIEYNAFWGCSNLSFVSFGSSHPLIRYSAFTGDRIQSIQINGPIEERKRFSVEDNCNEIWCALWICEDGEYRILGKDILGQVEGDTLIITGTGSTYDFNSVRPEWGRSITKVILPVEITGIGNNTFQYFSSLTDVYYDGTLAQKKQLSQGSGNTPLFAACWHCDDGNFTACGDNLYWSLDKSTRTLTITGSGAMWDFVSSENSQYGTPAPWGQKIVAVSLPAGLTRIGNCAFYQCAQLSSVDLPEGLQSIGDSAFYGCDGLSEIVIPDTVTELGGYAFESCTGLESVQLSEALTEIDYSTFSYCSSLQSITIPDGVTSINYSAFESCHNLSEVQLPDGLRTIGSSTFLNCTSLQQIDLPDSLTSISWDTFRDTGLLEVVLPEGLRTIGSSAFRDCSQLQKVTIPGSVNGIGAQAFENCLKLNTIVFTGEAPVIRDNAFTNVTATAFYPDDGSWWESDRGDFGGHITWIPYNGEPVTYTVSYDANGGSSAPNDQVKAHGVELQLSKFSPVRESEASGTVTVTLDSNTGEESVSALTAETTREYTFTEWNTEQDGSGDSYAPGDSFNGNESVTLYAQWDSSLRIEAVALPTPTRDGYIFRGWAEDASAESGMTGNYTPTGNVTLYAIWADAASSPTIRVGSGKGAAGKQIEIPITLENNPGIYALSFSFRYDSDALKLTAVTPNTDAFPGSWQTGSLKGAAWVSNKGDISENETILTLTFEVLAGAADGEYSVEVIPGEIINEAMEDIEFAAVSGKMTVSAHVPGDVNGDGNVTTKDFVVLMKYLAGEDIAVDASALDINGDGNVTTKDFVILMKYLAGEDVTIY